MSDPAQSPTALLAGIDPSDAGVARLFERVRDIPFSFAAHRDADMLLTCGSGTCAPKHALLEEALLGIGHRTSFPRQLAERLNDWLGALRSRRSRAVPTAGPPS
jgi:hypothetical protein